jgi:hypothetical protein
MKKKCVFIITIVLATLASCHNDKTALSPAHRDCCKGPVEIDMASRLVIGTWNWIETVYFAGDHGELMKTPQNTGKMLTYTFSKDSLIISSGGKVEDRIRYQIGKLQDITHFPQDTILIIRLLGTENGNRISLLHFCGDSIILVNSYNNLGGNIKLRKAENG